MNLTNRIVEAGNSPDITVNSFEELKNIREMDVYLNGRKIGVGAVGTLPYGVGHLIKMNNKIMISDAHWPFNGSGVVLEPRKRFQEASFPITASYMD